MTYAPSVPQDLREEILACRLRFNIEKPRQEQGGQITIYRNPNTGTLEHLNATGTIIYSASLQGRTIGEIIPDVLNAFSLSEEDDVQVVSHDVFLFMRGLEKKGLVEVEWLGVR